MQALLQVGVLVMVAMEPHLVFLVHQLLMLAVEAGELEQILQPQVRVELAAAVTE
jgi:hypothetical protein